MRAHSFINRWKGETVWEDSHQVQEGGARFLIVLTAELRQRARDVDLELVSATPIAGWVSKAHSRDGKEWPCREETNGARPVWIWTAK